MSDATQRRQIRLLLSDVDPDVGKRVFTDTDLDDFLTLSRGTGTPLVMRAAALAIETNADNEALASKVLNDGRLSTDGAKLSAALLARAKVLRATADRDEADDADEDDDVYFALVPTIPGSAGRPELTSW